MVRPLDLKRLGLGLAALLSTAALIWFGTGLAPLWPLTWFAPVPVLLFAIDAPMWSAAVIAGLAMIFGMLNLWGLFFGALEVPLPIIARIYVIEGVMFALAALLFRALARRQAWWAALLSFPSFWVTFEWLLNVTSPHGTGGSLAYTQLAFLPFLQLASVTGPWGMSFLLLAFPAALAIAVRLRTDAPRQGLAVLGSTAAVIGAVLLFGTARLLLPSSAGTPLKVGLVASDGPNEHVADPGTAADELFRAYEARVLALARQGAAVVVLPEKTAVFTEADAARIDAGFQSLANESHVTIVVGVLRVVQRGGARPQQLRYNQARIYSAGGPVRTYDKEHMLPPFESNLTPGTALTVVSSAAPDNLWGVAICKDMDFTELSRRYGEAGAGLLLVPAWDFFLDWIQHGHMAIMRGVESGFSVVRSAKGGSLFVSDDRGRIVAEISSNAAPFTALLTSVSQRHDKTAFLVLGDSFAWVAVVILVCCLARLMGLTDPRVQPAPRPEATP